MSTPAVDFNPARKLNLYFRISRAGTKTFTFVDGSGVAVNISGFQFALYVKDCEGDKLNKIALTVGSGLTVSGAGNNVLTAALTVANTAVNEGEYYFELYKGSTSKTYLSGKAFAHNGKYDGVESDSENIIIDDAGTNVTIQISDGGTMTGSEIINAIGSQTANKIFAGPTSGGAAAPTFRDMVLADIKATGTPDNTKFLRGDYAWEVPAGGGGGTAASIAEILAGTDNTKFLSSLGFRKTGVRIYNLEAFGAVHDGINAHDGLITSGTNILTSASGLFTAAHVGKTIEVSGAGVAGARLVTTIAGFTSSTQVTLTANASTTVGGAGKNIFWGTDDTAAIQLAINTCYSTPGGEVWAPNGIYMLNGALQTSVSGTNPNSQLYIPSGTDTQTTMPEIRIVGESHNPFSYYYNIYPTQSGVIFQSTIGGSGTNPSILGSIGLVGNFESFNYNYLHMENICLRFSSNHGTDASMSGFNLGKMAYKTVINCSYGADVPMNLTASAVSTETFGFFMSTAQDNGPNTFINCISSSVTYAYVGSEHCELINCQAFASAHALLALRGNFGIIGNLESLSCRNHVLIQQGTILGVTTGGLSNAKLNIELRVETNSPGTWYDTSTWFSDAGNFGTGTVKVTRASADFNALIGTAAISGCTNLNLVKHESLLSHKSNQAGGGPTSSTGIGTTNPVLQLGDGIAVSGDTHFPFLALVTNQSATAANAVGSIVGINAAIAGADKRLWAMTPVTFGATNTGQLYESFLLAGSIVNTSIKDRTKHQFFTPLIIDADISPTQLTSNTDNYAPTNSNIADIIRWSSNQDISLTGLALGATQVDGREVYLLNIGAFKGFIPSDSTSTAANRIVSDGATLVQRPGKLLKLKYDGTSSRWRVVGTSSLISLDYTITAGGTTGAQTINKPSGSLNIAAGQTSIVLTNSFVTATSLVQAWAMTNDATGSVKNVVPAVGSATINMTAAVTAETKIGFLVIN